MNLLDQLWVAEYSLSQRAIHVSTVRQMLDANIGMLRDNFSNDYLVIAIAESHDEATRLASEFRQIRDEKFPDDLLPEIQKPDQG